MSNRCSVCGQFVYDGENHICGGSRTASANSSDDHDFKKEGIIFELKERLAEKEKEIAGLRERLKLLLETIKSSSKCSIGGIDTHYSLKIRVSSIEEIEQAIEKAVKA